MSLRRFQRVRWSFYKSVPTQRNVDSNAPPDPPRARLSLQTKDANALSRSASAEPKMRSTPGSRGIELMEEAAVRGTPSPSAAQQTPATARTGELQPRSLNLTPVQMSTMPSPRRVRRTLCSLY